MALKQPIPEVRIDAIRVSRLGFDDTLALLGDWMDEDTPRHVATANLDFLELTSHHAELAEVLDRSAIVTADGQPLVWLAKMLGKPTVERVAGSDMVLPLAAEAARRGCSIYLLGAAEGVGAKVAEILRAKHPGIKIVGVSSPMIDMNDEEGCRKVAADIRESGADLLIAALGTPKQELFLGNYINEFGCSVAIGIGATLDFIAGTQKRAPLIWQRFGAEWLYRFLNDPRRLGGRYARDIIYLARLFFRILRNSDHDQIGKSGRPQIGQGLGSPGSA